MERPTAPDIDASVAEVMTDDNELFAMKQVVRRFFEEVVGGNLDLVEELVAPDCVIHGAGNEFRGVEAVRQNLSRQKNAFDEWKARVIFQIAEGDTVASHLEFTGRHVGETLGIPATGKDVAFTGMFFDRVMDGKIVEGWHRLDYLTLLRQLNAFPCR
ncbi:MAG: ester cyclase [Chloroflexi bacterium]|nr:ester cyclase [Chloroflexota bacterium]